MRSFRNPRYAPESLERKLHPSGLAALPAAQVYAPPATDSAMTMSVIRTTPTTPTTTGTEPAPPPGNGTPPDCPPTSPVGPGEPA